MTGATHMLAAAAIYKVVPLEKPLLLAMALASHFVLDAIPHYELTRKVNYILGIIVGAFLIITALLNKDALLLMAAFLGALPDLNTLVFKNYWLMGTHRRIHSKRKVYRPWVSIGFELTFAAVCIVLLIWW